MTYEMEELVERIIALDFALQGFEIAAGHVGSWLEQGVGPDSRPQLELKYAGILEDITQLKGELQATRALLDELRR